MGKFRGLLEDKEVLTLLNKIIALPFNQQLANGSLKKDRFDTYLIQDVWYLKKFSKILQRVADKDPQSPLCKLELASYIKVAEEETNKQLISPNFLFASKKVMEPEIKGYKEHLEKASKLSFAEAVAACIPCFWVYKMIGELLPISEKNQNKTYKEWMKTYIEEEFIEKAEGIINVLDALDLDNYIQKAVRLAFMKSLQFEHDFFESIMVSKEALTKTPEQVTEAACF